MSEKTGIEWTSHTMNPWIGCTKVSPGCAHCYAQTLDTRYYGGTHWGKGAPRIRTSDNTWNNPVKWDRQAAGTRHHGGECPRVFPSLCDWLDDEVPIEWLADFLKLIHDTPNLDWLLLTKRPENWGDRLTQACHERCQVTRDFIKAWRWGAGLFPPNIWVGVSVEDQARADERIPLLLQIPAKVHFLSVEPLLSKVDLLTAVNGYDKDGYRKAHLNPLGVDWVIVGGESGKDRRDCGVEAICDVARQCVAAGVPCFVKQASAFKPGQRGNLPDDVWNLKQFPR